MGLFKRQFRIKTQNIHIENRAKDIKEAKPDMEMDQIYSEIVNVQKKPSLFTPLHFAIKYKNLRIIRCLVFDYNVDTSIEDKNGHDAIEYLHLGDINHSKYTLNYYLLNLNFSNRNAKFNGWHDRRFITQKVKIYKIR